MNQFGRTVVRISWVAVCLLLFLPDLLLVTLLLTVNLLTSSVAGSVTGERGEQ